jgi:hypothetical protein
MPVMVTPSGMPVLTADRCACLKFWAIQNALNECGFYYRRLWRNWMKWLALPFQKAKSRKTFRKWDDPIEE